MPHNPSNPDPKHPDPSDPRKKKPEEGDTEAPQLPGAEAPPESKSVACEQGIPRNLGGPAASRLEAGGATR